MAESFEDVAPARVVRAQPRDATLFPWPRIRTRPRLHFSAVQRDVVCAADHGLQLHDDVVPECPFEQFRPVQAAEPAPEHEVGARRDCRSGLELHEAEPPNGVEQVDRTSGIEQLRPHGDAAGFAPREPVRDGHPTMFPGSAGRATRTVTIREAAVSGPQ